MANAALKLVSPATENRTVTPLRRSNAELRPREHLTEHEIDKLVEATRGNRWGQRDTTMILIAFRHGLRASELCGLQWSDVEFETGTLHLRRTKGGTTATHPLLGDELLLPPLRFGKPLMRPVAPPKLKLKMQKNTSAKRAIFLFSSRCSAILCRQ